MAPADYETIVATEGTLKMEASRGLIDDNSYHPFATLRSPRVPCFEEKLHAGPFKVTMTPSWSTRKVKG